MPTDAPKPPSAPSQAASVVASQAEERPAAPGDAPPSTPAPGRDLRRKFIDASLALVTERGVEGLTLRDLAKRVGVTHPAVYRYFPDKAALLASVAEEGFWEMRSAVIRACAPYPDTRSRFNKLVDAYVRFAVEHPAHFRLMFGPEAAEKWSVPSLRAAETATFNLCLDAVIEGQRDGLVRQGEAREIALAGWAMMHGLASLVLNGLVNWVGVQSTSPEYLASVLETAFFTGVGPGAPFPSTHQPDGPPYGSL
ncbi:MAG TPA: TetR/AcrR family transcriptional regulator [Polyangiaceae bacterium]|nr:TetR/AcrR family transcriptional regulator [Polyangiaceae bacterium]